jgi:hypothetical protein
MSAYASAPRPTPSGVGFFPMADRVHNGQEEKLRAISGHYRCGWRSGQLIGYFEACNRVQTACETLGFIVEAQYATPGTLVNAKPIPGGLEWLSAHRSSVLAICGIGAPYVRSRRLCDALPRYTYCGTSDCGRRLLHWPGV